MFPIDCFIRLYIWILYYNVIDTSNNWFILSIIIKHFERVLKKLSYNDTSQFSNAYVTGWIKISTFSKWYCWIITFKISIDWLGLVRILCKFVKGNGKIVFFFFELVDYLAFDWSITSGLTADGDFNTHTELIFFFTSLRSWNSLSPHTKSKLPPLTASLFWAI